MSEQQLTEAQVRESIVPKSDQLNADDLIAGPITATVTKVRRGDKEQPVIVEIEGHRPYKPCKTMRRILVAAWTDDAKKWIGQRMTLFCDPDVKWGGVKVGGIRISHLSGIDAQRPYSVTVSRGVRKEVTIKPIATLTPDEQKFVTVATGELAAVERLDQLKEHGRLLANKSKPVQDALRPVYAKRLKELQGE